ncbi:5700_t:CDS:1, partial [Cetraspora pellucida]
MPNESSLVMLILDPRMKNFLFMDKSEHTQQRSQAESLLRNLYNQLKQDQTDKNLEGSNSIMNLIDSTKNIFSRMWANNQSQTENEIFHYLLYLKEPKNI